MSALRPAFFILYLESYISRLNEILRHDLTLSVGEPDNAAAKQGQELRSVRKQVSTCGHKFSMLENVLSHGLPLVGECLPQTLL